MHRTNSRLLTNTLWNVVHEAISKGAIFLSNLYLARVLKPDNYGLLVLAQSVTMYLWLAVDLGASIYGIREVSRHKDDAQAIFNELLTMRMTLGVVVFGAYATIILGFIPVSPTHTWVFLGNGLYLCVYAFYTDWVFKGLERFHLLCYGGVLWGLAYAAGIVLMVKGPEDVGLAAFIWPLSFVPAGLALLAILSKRLHLAYRPCFDVGAWWGHVRESIMFTAAGVVSAAYMYLPIFLASNSLTARELGVFSAPFRIVQSITAPGFYITSAFFPVLCDAYYHNHAEFRKIFVKLQVIMLLCGGTIGGIGYGFSQEVNQLFLGDAYNARVLAILALLIPMIFLRYSYTVSLRASEYQRFQILPFLVAIVTLTGCYALLRWLEIVDVLTFPAMMLVAETSVLATFFIISKRTYDRA